MAVIQVLRKFQVTTCEKTEVCTNNLIGLFQISSSILFCDIFLNPPSLTHFWWIRLSGEVMSSVCSKILSRQLLLFADISPEAAFALGNNAYQTRGQRRQTT